MATNTQQIFSTITDGKDVHCISVFGNENNFFGSDTEGVPFQPNTELEFMLFADTKNGFVNIEIEIGTQRPVVFFRRRQIDVNINNGGVITVDDSPPPQLPPNGIDGGGSGNHFQEMLTVNLFCPGDDVTPVGHWELLEANTFYKTRLITFPVFLGFPSPDFREKIGRSGWWRFTIKLQGTSPAFLLVKTKSFYKTIETKQKILTNRWLNHIFSNVFAAITPRANLQGRNLSVAFNEELHDTYGIQTFTISQDIDPLHGYFELTNLSAKATSSQEVYDLFTTRIKELNIELSILNNILINETDSNSKLSLLGKINTVNEVIKEWYNKLDKLKNISSPDDIAIRIIPIFSNPELSLDYYNIEAKITFEKAPILYICLGSQSNLFNKFAVAYADTGTTISDTRFIADITDIAQFILEILNIDVNNSVNNIIESAIEENSASIHKYLYLALAKATNQTTEKEGIIKNNELKFVTNYYPAVIENIKVNSELSWIVNYHDEPRHPDIHQRVFFRPPEILIDLSTIGLASQDDSSDGVSIPDTLGGISDKFKVTSGAALERLDKIKTIIVIMMENRSFDHLLGSLAQEHPERGYLGFSPEFTNPSAPPHVNPIKVGKAKNMGFKKTTVTPISPEHGHQHVMFQIGDGTNDGKGSGKMQGFTRDILNRFSEIQESGEVLNFNDPSLVMSYYDKEQLPTYSHIADNFKILDHWFAAHPGPTWPNRIATHTGKLIELNNFNTKDERIGYFKEQTIFDILTYYGVDWRFLESNVSIMRIFDKYRLDDKNVIPLHDEDYLIDEDPDDKLTGLEVLLRQETLPRVIFIEPRFSDVPPIILANDDSPRTDLKNGQEFIRLVCNKLYGSKHWKDISLLITYDEHGGFFDHLPPPGTPESGISGIPKIHPEGPEYLGVRVPSLLISPYVSAGSVSHTVFDHTSILKTILVHNRSNFTQDVFTGFSERVNLAEHLGVAMDLDEPRAAPNILPKEQTQNKLVDSGIKSYYLKENMPGREFDFHEALKTIFMPK